MADNDTPLHLVVKDAAGTRELILSTDFTVTIINGFTVDDWRKVFKGSVLDLGTVVKTAPLPQLSGDACTNCGNFALVRSGTCMTCQACGETTGCS